MNQERYIELLKKTLINEIYIENEYKIFYLIQCLADKNPISYGCLVDHELIPQIIRATVSKAKEIGATVNLHVKDASGQRHLAPQLRNFLEFPHTMIGRKRIDNLHDSIETILRENVPGDLIETGIWRGGATIFMRGVLAAHDVTDRSVWVADSFEGLPPPALPQDQGMEFTKKDFPVLAVGLERVKELFERYGLLDEQVKFLRGWFKDTLAKAPIEELALFRLDGDLYESTMDALEALYNKVSVGGFVIIDDYYALEVCKEAVDEFRDRREITDEIIEVDAASVYWRKA